MPVSRVVQAIIPAAGFGTRQLPATKSVPKELLPVFDRPSLQHVIDEALSAGLSQLGIVTLRGKGAVEDYLDFNPELDGYLKQHGQLETAWELDALLSGVQICYVRQRQPRGLGHAVLAARPLVGELPFAVLLADDVVDQPTPLIGDLLDLQAEVGGATLALLPVAPEEARLYGMAQVVTTPEGRLRVLDLVEKPAPSEAPSNLAVVGRYVLPPDIFGRLAAIGPGAGGEIQLTDALRELAREGRVHGVLVTGRRFDVGTPLGLLEASVHYAWKRKDLQPSLRTILTRLLEDEP